MKLCIYEYNITPNVENRNELLINVEEDKVTYNDKVIENGELIAELNQIVENNKPTLLDFNEIQHSNYKGGRQRSLKVEVDGVSIKLIGNTDNNQIANFYNDFKEEIINVVSKY